MSSIDADRLLIEHIRQGDARVWENFIAQFEGRLLAYVTARLGNRATSEDVVQETFLGFLISLPNYDEETPVESWLFSIAAHKLTDHLRREGRRPAVPLIVDDSSSGVREPAGKARQASSLARSSERRVAEERIIADCLKSLIQEWIRRREFERLQCIELLFVLGWSNKAVAKRLGISEQAVANHKQFVVSKLKEAALQARLHDFNLADFGVSPS